MAYQLTITSPNGPVGYDELVADGTQSPRYSYAHGNSRVTRTFLCDWDRRDDFVKAVLGYPYIVNAQNSKPFNAYVARALPMAVADSLTPARVDGGSTWLYAMAVVEQVGVSSTGLYDNFGVATFQYAKTTVQYEGPSFKIVSDGEVALESFTQLGDPLGYVDEATLLRYVTRNRRPVAEFVTIPRGLMQWFETGAYADKATKVEFATARLLPAVELVYVWHQVPFIPQAVTTHVGKINSNAVIDGEFTYPIGTLLLTAAEVKPYRHGSGAFVQDVTYRIKYLEPEPNRGHNFFYRQRQWAGTAAGDLARVKLTADGTNDKAAIKGDAGTGTPYPTDLAANASGKGVYEYADFNNLFRWQWQ